MGTAAGRAAGRAGAVGSAGARCGEVDAAAWAMRWRRSSSPLCMCEGAGAGVIAGSSE